MLQKALVIYLLLMFHVITTACSQNKPALGASPTPELEAEQVTTDYHSFIPPGWHILDSASGDPALAEGDLNKDGISDVAFVIEGTSESDEAAPRTLLIAFGNASGGYDLSIRADKAILKADEGGVWGDPLEGISIDRGSVLIRFYGGSNWRWYGTYRFRYQSEDWYLIGATRGSYHTSTSEGTTETDYNFLTGEFIEKNMDEQGNETEKKGNRGIKKLLKLSDFDAANPDGAF